MSCQSPSEGDTSRVKFLRVRSNAETQNCQPPVLHPPGLSHAFHDYLQKMLVSYFSGDVQDFLLGV